MTNLEWVRSLDLGKMTELLEDIENCAICCYAGHYGKGCERECRNDLMAWLMSEHKQEGSK